MPNTLSSDGKYFRWEPKQQEQQEQQHWAHPQKDKQLHYDWRVALMFCLKQGWLLCFFLQMACHCDPRCPFATFLHPDPRIAKHCVQYVQYGF